MTTPLSPAARAVLYAANRASSYGPDDCLNDSRFIAAAALRAAADQVVPEADIADTEEWNGQSAWQQAEHCVRFRLLSLANEMKGQ
jgi:hypothetical protein